MISTGIDKAELALGEFSAIAAEEAIALALPGAGGLPAPLVRRKKALADRLVAAFQDIDAPEHLSPADAQRMRCLAARAIETVEANKALVERRLDLVSGMLDAIQKANATARHDSVSRYGADGSFEAPGTSPLAVDTKL